MDDGLILVAVMTLGLGVRQGCERRRGLGTEDRHLIFNLRLIPAQRIVYYSTRMSDIVRC